MAGPFLSIPPCTVLRVRDQPPNCLEYAAAEVWIRQRYGEFFTTSRPAPVLITSQLERLFSNYDSLHDDVIDLVMTVLERDFRNPLLPRLVAAFKKLMQAGASETELRALLQQITPGGDLKPDVLGIGAGGPVIELDGVEIGTVKTAKPTYDELQHKLSVLRDLIIPQLRIQLPELSIRKQMSVPTDVTVSGSKWRPAEWERILPLPVKVGSTGNVSYVDWICYHPTMTWQAPNSPPPAPGSTGGTDGLVIYHIHRLTAASSQVPSRVKSAVQKAIRESQQQKALALSLNPALSAAIEADKDKFDPAAKEMVAYLGAGALLVMVLGVAWEAGIFTGAAALSEGGLSTVAGAIDQLGPILARCGRIAFQFWPEVSVAAPLLSKR